MNRIRPDVDVIMDVMQAILIVQSESAFTRSLLQQYQERGGLSKKQLQGLYSKAGKIPGIPPGKLATLEAIILKRPTRYKSVLPVLTASDSVRDETTGAELNRIFARYPEHKRLLFLRSRYDHGEQLSAAEITEIMKIGKMMDARK